MSYFIFYELKQLIYVLILNFNCSVPESLRLNSYAFI
jgi:hypothetical protein